MSPIQMNIIKQPPKFDITPTVQLEKDLEAPYLAGNKRHHISDNSDLDKDNGVNTDDN